MCDFKMAIYPNNTRTPFTEKSFDMAKRFEDKSPFELDLGNGIILTLCMTFKLPTEEDADMIRRDTTN